MVEAYGHLHIQGFGRINTEYDTRVYYHFNVKPLPYTDLIA